MNSAQTIILAQTQWLSAEMLELLKEDIVLMANWKWIVLAASLFLGLTFRPLIQYLIQKIKKIRSLGEDSTQFWKILILGKIEAPLSWILTGIIWLIIIDATGFHPVILRYSKITVQILLSLNFMRLAYQAVEAFGDLLVHFASKSENSLNHQLAPFATKSLKVLVVTLGVLVILQNLGIDVTALLAGVGIAGMALAFAAKDTVENVFGSLTIIFDGPFKIGDYVKVNDTEGVIEDIGFRSTRIRTLYNSVVTLPNAVMAREKIDNFQVRPKRRIRFQLGIEYETSLSNIQNFCFDLKSSLEQEPLIEAGTVIVYFQSFGDFSLNILVNYHVLTIDNLIEIQFQEKMNFKIMQLAEKNKVNFAYPTQKVISSQ